MSYINTPRLSSGKDTPQSSEKQFLIKPQTADVRSLYYGASVDQKKFSSTSSKSSPRQTLKPSIRKQRKTNQFKELIDIMKERKFTFVRFAFKPTEICDDSHLKPIIKDLSGNQSNGTMLVNELWPESNFNNYMRSSNFAESKRTLKKVANRFVQTSSQSPGNKDGDGKKQTIFTMKEEQQLKLKLQSTSNNTKFRSDLSKKFFSNDHSWMKVLMKKNQMIEPEFTEEAPDPNRINKEFRKNYDRMISEYKSYSPQRNTHNVKGVINQDQKKQLNQLISKMDFLIQNHQNEIKPIDHILHILDEKLLKFRPKASK